MKLLEARREADVPRLSWKPEKPRLEAMISDAWAWMLSHPDGYG